MNWKKTIDAHSHLPESDLNVLKNSLTELKINKFVIMGTSPKDWPIVEELAKTFPNKIIPSFGVHPWSSEQLPENWFTELESYVDRHPNCLIGEIGLDKVAKNRETNVKYDFKIQEEIFEKQLDFALKKNLNISCHTVQCQGKMLEILQKKIKQVEIDKEEKKKFGKINFMMHSFNGSNDILSSLLRLKKNDLFNFYFSVSKIVNGRREEEKWREAIKLIPDERILGETDLGGVIGVLEKALTDSYEMIAKSKGWTLEKTCDILHQNCERFLSKN
ncbi:hypothetical protein HDU92_005350 [Lobulomyces angularis]|nr:hypothetical protein HDU92_005350 [Lobulomyces angularis]